MALSEDLVLFFADFGVDATLPSGGTVRGVFDDGFVHALGIGTSEKAFTAPASGVSSLVYGNTLTINGTAYTVAELRPDGTGITQVMLK